jgi:hypothetical protein
VADEIQIETQTGLTAYFQLVTTKRLFWNNNTNALEAYNSANWLNYLNALIEPIAGTGRYFGSLPEMFTVNGGPAGNYLIPFYGALQTPAATTDPVLPLTMFLDWSGTAINSLQKLGQLPWSLTGTPDPVNPPEIAKAIQLPARQNSLQFAQAMLNALLDGYSSNPTGAMAISVDGESTSYLTPNQRTQEIQYWTTRVAILSGKRRRATTIRLDRF